MGAALAAAATGTAAGAARTSVATATVMGARAVSAHVAAAEWGGAGRRLTAAAAKTGKAAEMGTATAVLVQIDRFAPGVWAHGKHPALYRCSGLLAYQESGALVVLQQARSRDAKEKYTWPGLSWRPSAC